MTLQALATILLCLEPVTPPGFSPAAFAHDHDEHDEDQARNALEKGEIVALDKVIAMLGGAAPGEISSVELEKENGTWIYEFKIISPDGRMLEVEVDAKTCKIIKTEKKKPKH